MRKSLISRLLLTFAGAMLLLAGTGAARAQAPAGEPIKIGFGMGLTGGLAASGKAALLAMQIWEEETNAKGGLLGRPVKLIYYDDQSNPATVPGIFTKLLDVDKVDLVVGDYGTNLLAPAMPVVIQHKMTFFGAVRARCEPRVPLRQILLDGADRRAGPGRQLLQGLLRDRRGAEPKAEDPGDHRRRRRVPAQCLGRRAQATPRKPGLEIVYDKTYPPTTTDFTPIIRAIDATNPDIVFSASYPPDAVGMVRAANEIGLKAKMFGGGLVGCSTPTIKQQLGPQLNGIVDYDFWEPAPTLQFPGVDDFLKKYQAQGRERRGRSARLLPAAVRLRQSAGVGRRRSRRPRASTRTSSPTTLRSNTFKTIVGDIKYGPNGEWAEPRVLTVQYHDVQGSDLEQWKNDSQADDPVAAAIRDRQGDLSVRGREEIATGRLMASLPQPIAFRPTRQVMPHFGH